MSSLKLRKKKFDKNFTARSANFYGITALDRFPNGTGTSAGMAQWHFMGILNAGAFCTRQYYWQALWQDRKITSLDGT